MNLPNSLLDLVYFHKANARFPTLGEEGFTGLRAARMGKHNAFSQSLDEQVPGWRTVELGTIETLPRKLAGLIGFYKEYNRFPVINEEYFVTFKNLRLGGYKNYLKIIDAEMPGWREWKGNKPGAVSILGDDAKRLMEKIDRWAADMRSKAMSAAYKIEKTITIDGCVWTGTVTRYPVLGQGCDFD